MKSAEIRRKFIQFFQARGHTEVPSGPLVPPDDPTLLFTNAGMVQFKRVFQGLERRDYSRAVTCQKCVRAGGKHNDLEQVGHTARHHTFFEMLGNFSFGQYFKKGAIEYGWEWVTSRQWLGIEPDRIYVTVHHSDDEARQLWRQVTGISDSRIFGLGDKDNFWQMGDTGPCGPCSELNVDLRAKSERGKADLTTEQFVELNEEGKLLEIWNLVFMQYDQQPGGNRSPLPAPSVDTGAGLERISAVMQQVPSNFDTDLFLPIIAHAVEIVGRPYDRGPAGAPYRVLADHARAVAFLLADGVYPSNEGRGYVLRRILRRAVRHAWLLGRREPTLAQLTRVVSSTMGEVYPELPSKQSHIERVTRAEEERFLETIEGGLSRLEELKGAKSISGEDAFKLYDTYGFPLDLTQMIAGEREQSVDVAGFESALSQQRTRSRAARKAVEGGRGRAKAVGEWVEVKKKAKQKWIGYESTKAETEPIAFRQTGDQLELILEENPFYAESGGQVSDTGVVKGEGWELTVEGVEKVDGKNAVVGTFGETFEPTPALAQVNEARRRNIERNHTATHLVHAALRKILGTHVRQAGSVVAPERLRFDFSHHGPIKGEQLATVEAEVNAHIWENVPIETRQVAYKEAIAAGAMALFGEKYGDVVRVVDVPGVSLELCGGTHVGATGQIALFRFTHETGAAAGVRRIEALTGPAAYRLALELQNRLTEAASLLKTQPEHVTRRIESMLEENRRLEKRVADLLREGGASGVAGGSGGAHATVVRGAIERIGDVELHIAETDLDDRAQIAAAMDGFRAKHKQAISVLFTRGERAGIHVAVTDDLVSKGVKAGDIANAIASTTGGKGGGRPHFASAGVGDLAKLPEARARTLEIVRDFAG
ncbi:MAG TPA: alanine--tRNA ligase [Gemmatimonadales bacterium]|nr:alanine--tRNA ligase [Gemmatimonadales bacterium]